jgi:hypothetical protein
MKIIRIFVPIVGHFVIIMSQDFDITLLKNGGDGIAVAALLQKIQCFGM